MLWKKSPSNFFKRTGPCRFFQTALLVLEISILSAPNRVGPLPSGLGHESTESDLFTQDHVTYGR